MATNSKAEQLRKTIADQVAAFRHPARLGEIYRSVQTKHGALTLGTFHDALRDLAACGAIRLSPYTGAMYALQDPECCLLVGREIMAWVESHAR